MKKKPLEFYFNDGSDSKDELELEAKKDLEKSLSELEDKKKLAESTVLNEEPVPYDLGKVYKNLNYQNSWIGKETDFQNSTYEEITPEEATKIIRKGDPETLRFIIEGKLILIDPERRYGTNDEEYRIRDVRRDHWYTTKSGNIVTDTARFPIPHLVKIADKIYVTNEGSTKRDPGLLAARKENNPEKNGAWRQFDSTSERRGRDPQNDYYIANAKWDYERAERYYKDYLARAENAPTDAEREKYLKYADEKLNDMIKYHKEQEKHLQQGRDYAARLRYYDSEKALNKNVNRFKQIKREEIPNANKEKSRYQNKLNDFDKQGDPDVTYYKNQISRKRQELERKLDELSDLEYSLDNAQFKSSSKRQEIVDKINQSITKVDDLNKELDDLLRKNENFKESKKLFDDARNNGLVEELIDTLDSLYCNRKSASAMLEQLEMNVDDVRSMLDL